MDVLAPSEAVFLLYGASTARKTKISCFVWKCSRRSRIWLHHHCTAIKATSAREGKRKLVQIDEDFKGKEGSSVWHLFSEK